MVYYGGAYYKINPNPNSPEDKRKAVQIGERSPKVRTQHFLRVEKKNRKY